MTLTQQQAIHLVQSIADDHGHLDEKTLATMNAGTRLKVERALLAKDQLIGQSVITLARELYSKDVRFIFELLQNADDNHFNHVKSSGQEPYVAFLIYHDKIVIDCNEDGFTEENLRAICSVGKSSKHGAQGYIGEKGIGFKSVFKVAWKVHVQSGPFSFCFIHRPGDSGMGMISPEWHQSEDSTRPPTGITRMTFTLHNNLDQKLQAAQRQSIVNEFKDLQPAMLLFLKKLRRIEVHFFDVEGTKESHSAMSLSAPVDIPNRAVITTTKTTHNSEPKTFSHHYHVTKLWATGLARNENRKYSPAEESSKAYSRTKVVLAFPLTDQSVPIIEPQDIFAFLPIRKIGFNFLIHTDFVTTANREDIVTSSQRNKGLRRHLAQAFVTAAEQMCEHPQLQFQWMRYLPHLSSNRWDSFWSKFSGILQEEITKVDVIIPFASMTPRPLTALKQWPSKISWLDHLDRPVFEDLPKKKAAYVSLEYQDSDLFILRDYGMKYLSWGDLISRAKADLRSRSSKMKSPQTDAKWHSLAANLLKRGLRNRKYEEEIKALNLLPLSDGSWTSVTKGGSVYFPTTTEGFSIPAELGLKFIKADAAVQPERNALFKALGVISASSDLIRSLVIGFQAKHRSSSFETSVDMLRFLYLTHPPDASLGVYDVIWVISSSYLDLNPTENDVYFEDESDPYGPAALGLEVNFLHPHYLQEPPQTPEDATRTGKDADKGWRNWLEQHIGIRTRLRLATKDVPNGKPALSEEILHVAEHQPTKFIGLLHHLWEYEGESLASNETLCRHLGSLEVLCEGGSREPLKNTILPTPKLRKLSQRYLEPTYGSRFLQLEISLPNTIGSWSFLAKFNIIMDDDLLFYLIILMSIASKAASLLMKPSRILRLYAAIQAKCLASNNISKALKKVRRVFAHSPLTYIPSTPGEFGTSAQWVVATRSCLLDAPADMRHRLPLDALYSQAFSDHASKSLSTVLTFFRETVKVSSCDHMAFVLELQHLKVNNCMDMPLIQSHYKRLRKCISSKQDDIEEVRKWVADKALVFYQPCNDGEPTWYSPADCVWSTEAGLRGKANLREQYPDLKEFFVDLLGVDLLKINMIYELLLQLDTNSPVDYQEAKTQLLVFSSLLPMAPEELLKTMKPKKLVKQNCLPVTCPDVGEKLVGAATEFTIIDRQGPMAEFWHHVRVLDFDMEEVHDLQAFIEWAGLTGRYLSKMVREVPCLGAGPKVPIGNPLFDIRKKAHEILSPRYQEGNGCKLYAQLRGAQTWETDDISAQLVLEMDGESYVVPLEKSDMYIAEEGEEGETSPPSCLTIYIPHDETDQDVCIQHKLPYKLMEWIMTDPGTGKTKPVDGRAVRVVTAVLNAKFASLPRILEREGVHDVDVPALVEKLDEDEDESFPEAEENVGVLEDDVEESIGDDEEGDVYEGDDVFDDVEGLSNIGPEEAAHGFEGDDVFDNVEYSDHDEIAQDDSAAHENGFVDEDEYADADQILDEVERELDGLSIEPRTPPRSVAVLSSSPSTPAGRGIIYTPLGTEPETPLRVPANPRNARWSPSGNFATPRTGYFQPSPNWRSGPRERNSTPSSSTQQYRELLSNMVSAGQQLRFPDFGNLDISPLRGQLPHTKDTANPLWMFSTWQQGAAGELFILELLKTLEPKLPDFCAEVNWTSKLRDHVTVHPTYANLGTWSGFNEISDLEYFDYTGAFTTLLTEKGYLPRSSNTGEQAGNPMQPKKYYIEVKCTSQGCDEPFYMSSGQYNKMQAICEQRDAVYIIFRVFNLYTDRIDVRLFVNPVALERQGLLRFSPERYSVRATP
ncbi:hypothetical protein QC761_609930 [Podospora bellae-mahoneyi]|uniref:Protein NO VEIN C-terminal domain-containing protein n=1 Tax=Podospora bellae-mahoneyi TaxID=2093777 RepID=A0ABR0FBL2_9PEZI|nr:hypothetical protein QC761_609930 [Podospora bellae-mahoneyi]